MNKVLRGGRCGQNGWVEVNILSFFLTVWFLWVENRKIKQKKHKKRKKNNLKKKN